MGIQFKNNAKSTLASDITNVATSLTVATGEGALFPTLTTGDYFYATLIGNTANLEVIKVTARSGDVMTIVRAQEGTTGQAFVTGNNIELRLTTQGILDKSNEISGLFYYLGGII